MQNRNKKIQAIFDTDIGCDIDDTWALIYFIKLGYFSPLLILNERGNTDYRLRIIAKMLSTMNHNDIPLGHGAKAMIEDLHLMPQKLWIENYSLHEYTGKIYVDGITALIEKIIQADEIVSVITIGPLTNIARALEKEPRIADRMHLYSMLGSIYEGLKDNSPPYPETNIAKDIQAAQYVLSKQKRMTIAPIDTTKKISIRGNEYQSMLHSKRPEIVQLMETYRIWTRDPVIQKRNPVSCAIASSNLYDVLAVYLAAQDNKINDICEIEDLSIIIDNQGMTSLYQSGYPVKCCSRWKRLDLFINHFVDVLLKDSVD